MFSRVFVIVFFEVRKALFIVGGVIFCFDFGCIIGEEMEFSISIYLLFFVFRLWK